MKRFVSTVMLFVGLFIGVGSVALAGLADGDVNSRLFLAIKRGDLVTVQSLTKQGADLSHMYTEVMMQPIHLAARYGYADVVEWISKQPGVNINAQPEPLKLTPLMYASGEGHMKAVETLLALGADKELKNLNGKRACDEARELRRTEIAEMMCPTPKSVKLADKMGNALGREDADLVVETFMEGYVYKEAPVLDRGGDKYNLWKSAIKTMNPVIIKAFLNNGADPNELFVSLENLDKGYPDWRRTYFTPLNILIADTFPSKMAQSEECIKLLLAAGAKTDQPTRQQRKNYRVSMNAEEEAGWVDMLNIKDSFALADLLVEWQRPQVAEMVKRLIGAANK